MALTKSAPRQLAPDQVAQYERAGYCIAENLFSSEEIDAIERFFEDYKRVGTAVFDSGSTFDEIDPTKRQLRAMHPHRYSAQALAWALQPRVVAALGDLLGHPPLLAQTMYYFKPPGAKGQGMHQDNFYLMAAPATCIAAWTAIDAADEENGCLYVVPQSNHKPIFCPETADGESWSNYGDSHIKPFPRDAKALPVVVPRGSTLFFNGQLIHGSGPNRTKHRSRRTFIGHYIDDTSHELSQFYHPLINARGETVGTVREKKDGGPCGDGFRGDAVH